MIIIVIISLLTCVTASPFVDIKCEYKKSDFTSAGELYTCFVENNLQISSDDVIINKIEGFHNPGKTIDDIKGLSIENKKIEYFPTNFGEKFMNLVALRTKNCGLKEIQQDDIKMLTNLVHLNLDLNNIETLDDDLFEFNTDLKVIWIGQNKIKFIGNSIFDKLTNLHAIDLLNNNCTNERNSKLANDRSALKKIKENCYKPELEMENLKLKYQKLKTKSSAKIKDLEAKNYRKTLEIINLKTTKLKNKQNSIKNDSIIDPDKPMSEDLDAQAENLQAIEENEAKNTEHQDINEDQVNILIIQSQEIEEKFNKAIEKCQTEKSHLEVQLNATISRSAEVENNLTENIQILTNKSIYQENENNELKGTILELESKLKIEKEKVIEISKINNENALKLQTCKGINTNLNNQIEEMSASYQNLMTSLSKEQDKHRNSALKFDNILTSIQNKFDNVQSNLTARFDSLISQASELLANEQDDE